MYYLLDLDSMRRGRLEDVEGQKGGELMAYETRNEVMAMMAVMAVMVGKDVEAGGWIECGLDEWILPGGMPEAYMSFGQSTRATKRERDLKEAVSTRDSCSSEYQGPCGIVCFRTKGREGRERSQVDRTGERTQGSKGAGGRGRLEGGRGERRRNSAAASWY